MSHTAKELILELNDHLQGLGFLKKFYYHFTA